MQCAIYRNLCSAATSLVLNSLTMHRWMIFSATEVTRVKWCRLQLNWLINLIKLIFFVIIFSFVRGPNWPWQPGPPALHSPVQPSTATAQYFLVHPSTAKYSLVESKTAQFCPVQCSKSQYCSDRPVQPSTSTNVTTNGLQTEQGGEEVHERGRGGGGCRAERGQWAGKKPIKLYIYFHFLSL